MSAPLLPGTPQDIPRSELVELGAITRPHGVRGELRVFLHNPDSSLLFEASQMFLVPANGPAHLVELQSARLGPKETPLVTLVGVSDREAADALRGVTLAVHERDLPPLAEGEWYHRDLIGLAVVGPAGEPLGVVEAVEPYPTVDCLRVRSDDGVREVPMAEPWLDAVDLTRGEVRLGSVDDLPPER